MVTGKSITLGASVLRHSVISDIKVLPGASRCESLVLRLKIIAKQALQDYVMPTPFMFSSPPLKLEL